jgi:pimeloyl-ACP methyl ester carboxylesterase
MPTSPVHDEFIIAGDLTFHYIQWGEQGPPIICLHGITANAFYFQALADDLFRDHRVFAYDLRGRGDSDKPEQGYDVPTHAADLSELIDVLELERPIVIGHSFGALVSLYFAAHYPEKLCKLVLIDAGAPLPWKAANERPTWLSTALNRQGIPVASFQEYIQRLKAAPYLGPYWNEYMDIYFDHDVRRQSEGSVVSKTYPEAGLADQLYLEEKNRPEQQWASVQVPTLLLRAGQACLSEGDQLVPEESAAAVCRVINDCRYVNFPSLNHYTINFGVESGPAQAIRDFIDEE